LLEKYSILKTVNNVLTQKDTQKDSRTVVFQTQLLQTVVVQWDKYNETSELAKHTFCNKKEKRAVTETLLPLNLGAKYKFSLSVLTHLVYTWLGEYLY